MISGDKEFMDRLYNISKTFNISENLGKKPNYCHYNYNNWLQINLLYTNFYLQEIFKSGGAIWLNNHGDLCYRLSKFDTVKTSTADKISILFGKIINMFFKIKQNPPKPINELVTIQTMYSIYVPYNDLIIVKDEIFMPTIGYEFIALDASNKLFQRNRFVPSRYLLQNPDLSTQIGDSIILQYIYHISNYHLDRFKYILNWIAVYFSTVSNSSNIHLILIGQYYSGINILFDNIIKPLFGEQYSIKINNDTLKYNKFDKIINEKIFYNIDNVSEEIVVQTKNEKNYKLFLNNKKLTKKNDITNITPLDGQILMTYNSNNIPFINQDRCTIFKIQKTINEMYIPNYYIDTEGASTCTYFKLINGINNDLDNFANILKLYDYDENYAYNYIPFDNDDKKIIVQKKIPEIQHFINAVKNKDMNYFLKLEHSDNELYNNLKEDFDKNKIKQKHLFLSFNAINPDKDITSPKTFMVKLREIDDDFFNTKNIKHGSGGSKYYHMK